MFVAASAQVRHSIRACTVALSQNPDTWFPLVVDSVENSSEKHLAAVGFHVGPVPVWKRVKVSIGTPVSVGDWVRIPLSWTPTFPASLSPCSMASSSCSRSTPRARG